MGMYEKESFERLYNISIAIATVLFFNETRAKKKRFICDML